MGSCCSTQSAEGDVELQRVQRSTRPAGNQPGRGSHNGEAVRTSGRPPTGGQSRGAPPIISHQPLSSQTLSESVRAISHALQEHQYALIGGIALRLLGSRRATKDIDLLVPNGHAAQVADLLAATGHFGTERLQSGRSRVWFKASNRQHYNVDIMEPRDIHQHFSDSRNDTILHGSTRLLTPILLLNYKCFSWQAREDGQKRLNDAQDILYLLSYMAESGVRTSARETYNATPDFLLDFLASYPHARGAFAAIGIVQ